MHAIQIKKILLPFCLIGVSCFATANAQDLKEYQIHFINSGGSGVNEMMMFCDGGDNSCGKYDKEKQCGSAQNSPVTLKKNVAASQEELDKVCSKPNNQFRYQLLASGQEVCRGTATSLDSSDIYIILQSSGGQESCQIYTKNPLPFKEGQVCGYIDGAWYAFGIENFRTGQKEYGFVGHPQCVSAREYDTVGYWVQGRGDYIATPMVGNLPGQIPIGGNFAMHGSTFYPSGEIIPPAA